MNTHHLIKITFRITITFLVILFFYFLGRVFICDQFIIPSSSMEPTLIPGDRVVVNKLLFGARIYTSFDFRDHAPFCSWRVKGFRAISPNDIIIFNVPTGYNSNKIEFKINYVFCKRCIGTPGDTVSIVNGVFKNNRYNKLIGNIGKQVLLSNTNNSQINKLTLITIPHDSINFGWTIKNMGPRWIPKKGDSILIDSSNYKLYARIIGYELNGPVSIYKDKLLINNRIITKHVFRNNYYFACGDNVLHSGDSRYWGFIPEQFIVGIVTRISYSIDPKTQAVLKNRILQKLI